MSVLECPAKINLYLRLVSKRPDGYHDIDTVFQEIDLADTLHWEPGGSDLSLVVEGADLGQPEDNLVLKAARLFARETGLDVRGAFSLIKRIPAGGGLGGGSSDASGALKLLNDHYGSPLDVSALAELGSRLGSDISFFLYGGRLRGTGRGTDLEKTGFECSLDSGFLLAPSFSISTAGVYSICRVPEGQRPAPRLGENDLLEAALAVSPEMKRLWETVKPVFTDGVFFMTGSGSTLVWLTHGSGLNAEQAKILEMERVYWTPFRFSAKIRN